MKRLGIGTNAKKILKGVGAIFGLALGVAAIFSGLHFSKKDDVDPSLDRDPSTTVVVDDEKKQDPIEKVDQNAGKYENSKVDKDNANNEHIHDEDGKNDPNRTEKDDPSGSMDIIEEESKKDQAKDDKEEKVEGEETTSTQKNEKSSYMFVVLE